MATDLQSPPDTNQPSVTSLVGGIITDLQDLVKQQAALIGTEIKEDVNKSIGAAISLAAGAGIAAMGGLLLCMMLALLIDTLWFPQAYWAGFLIVGGVLAVVGLVMLYAAIKRFETIKALPETRQALKETVTWQTNPK
jgi:uncharacterized membrane protein YqjE